MLTVNQLKKSFGLDPLFESVNFTVNQGECIGLVGPNGCGKTTLLRIIAGVEKADNGVVMHTPSDLRVGYLAQGLVFNPEDTLGSYVARMEGDIADLSQRLEVLAEVLSNGSPHQVNYQEEYDEVLAQLALDRKSVV